MRKILSIFFFSIYLPSSSQVNELVRIKKLVNHYLTHTSQDGSLSFLEYLDIHSTSGQLIHQHRDPGAHLPFKIPQRSASTPSPALEPPVNIVFNSDLPVTSRKANYNILPALFYSNNSSNLIWQPPRALA